MIRKLRLVRLRPSGTRRFRWLSSRAELSSSETLARSRLDPRLLNHTCVAHPKRTSGSHATGPATAGKAVDQAGTRPGHNWLDPFARPGDRLCASCCGGRSLDLKRGNHGDTVRVAGPQVLLPRHSTQLLTPPLRHDATFLAANCQNSAPEKNRVPMRAW